MKAEDFIPQVIERRFPYSYATMLVQIRPCHICGQDMLKADGGAPFPVYFKIDLDSQMKKAGFVAESAVDVEGEPICVKCVTDGLAYFVCALCNEKRSTNLIQETFGDPAEFLCRLCYETVPAKQWDQKTEELYERHRYDWE